MRSFFARMSLFVVLCATTGCVSRQYEGDSINAGGFVAGYLRYTTPVQPQMKNFLTGNWENVPGTVVMGSQINFLYRSWGLTTWHFYIPTTIAAKYRSGNFIEMRFMQGGNPLMTFERNAHSAAMLATTAESCVIADLYENYENPEDYYEDSNGYWHVLAQEPFLDCGLQTSGDGVLRLRLN